MGSGSSSAALGKTAMSISSPSRSAAIRRICSTSARVTSPACIRCCCIARSLGCAEIYLERRLNNGGRRPGCSPPRRRARWSFRCATSACFTRSSPGNSRNSPATTSSLRMNSSHRSMRSDRLGFRARDGATVVSRLCSAAHQFLGFTRLGEDARRNRAGQACGRNGAASQAQGQDGRRPARRRRGRSTVRCRSLC